MSEGNKKQRMAEDEALEREIRDGRKFTLEEAIGRLAGPGAMKGISPVTRLQQAEVIVSEWLTQHMTDSAGALKTVLHRAVKESSVLLNNADQPLVALAAVCQHILDSEYLLAELVRQADFEWGQIMDERPHFEIAGRPPHPDDPYTLASVERTLRRICQQLATQIETGMTP